jgi:cytochrome b
VQSTPSSDPSRAQTSLARVLVWDAPLRVFHWMFALCFIGAYLTAESKRWAKLHNTLGYTVGGLVLLRLVWGVVGTRHARFSAFVRGPRAAADYLASLLRGKPDHHTGHNPAGGLVIVALLGLALFIAATGWVVEEVSAGKRLERVHEAAAKLMLALVLLHVAGVLVGSWLHRENLVRGMLTGHKLGTPQEAIERAWRGLALLLLAAVLGFWATQWR